MTRTAHRGFGALDRAAMVLLLSQALLLLVERLGPEESRAGVLSLLAATVVAAVANRRLAGAMPRFPGPFVGAWRAAVLVLLAALTAIVALDRVAAVPASAPPLIALLMFTAIALKGAAVGKLPPFGPLGLRVPWTLRSRLGWDRAHRLLGRVLFGGGLVGLVASPFLPFTASVVALASLMAVAVSAALLEARRGYNLDPEVVR